jgi:hypothetical protein
MRVCCLRGLSSDAVGPRGVNAAREYAVDLNMTWNGIGSDRENTREAGM